MSTSAKYERQKKLVVVLRFIVLVAGVYQIVWGERIVGAAILLSLAVISLPALFTHNLVRSTPLEFELILVAMVTIQYVLGETFNFYDIPYYDKVVHFILPLFLGYISAILAYTLMATGNLRMSVVPAIFLIVLVTLGIGAIWEIGEYLSDILFGTYFQGSHTASPLVDTMNDLIVDTLGGIFGAILALRYIRREQGSKDSRLPELAKEIDENMFRASKSKG